jgi:hypothetical protein
MSKFEQTNIPRNLPLLTHLKEEFLKISWAPSAPPHWLPYMIIIINYDGHCTFS